MRRSGRARILCLAVAGFLAVGLSGCGGEGRSRTFLSLGTGGTGGIYYPLGGALASLLSTQDTLRQYTAEVTGGSVENVNRILTGQIDLGFALAVTVYEAYHGSPDFPEPATELRIVAPLYPNVTHILVPASSPARTLADLGGLRVSVGSAGSGTEQISRQLLEVHGLSYDEVQERFLSFNESAAALRDGALDAAIFSVGIPAAAVLEATTTGSVRLLPVLPDKVEELARRYPYYSAGVIPRGSYPSVEEDIPTVSMMNWLVGPASLPGDVVKRILNILAHDRVSLERVHEMAGSIEVGRLREAPIPLHDAARAFLDELVPETP